MTDWARRRGPREGQTEVSIQCSAGTTARVRLLRAASNEGVWSEFIGALGADGTLCNPRLLEGHSETELILRVTLMQRTPGGSSFVGSPGARAEGWVDERFREKTSTLLLTFDVDPSDLGQNKVTHADVALLREILR
ncbi:MAG TPA: hypothetical protein VLC09_19225 [Polyangiaceae bacterium]|nr:hypothetical protein [Polyangiaceae bacterium]